LINAQPRLLSIKASRANEICCSIAPTAEADEWLFGYLESKLADAAGPGYTLRTAQVPATAPESTLPTIRHQLAPKGITLYRDGNAWCPFCERVWLQLLEKGCEYNTVLLDIGEKKPPWYTDVIPTGQTPSAVIDGKIVWESVDIMLDIEAYGEGKSDSLTSLLPEDPESRERVVAELRAFDSPDKGPGVGSAGYAFMRGAPFGQEAPGEDEAEAKIDELRAAFEAKLAALDERLSISEGPWFEDEFGVLDVALWPVLERMSAGLLAFRGYALSDAPYPSVCEWLHAMRERSSVAKVGSDAGTLVRLFSKVFGMKGAQSYGDETPPAAGSKAAREAAAKLVANRAAVRDDILLHTQLGKGDVAGLSPSESSEVVEVALALVAARLAKEEPPAVMDMIADSRLRASAGIVVCAALSFLRARVSAPRDMSAAAAAALREACTVESSMAFDRFGYV